MTPKNYIIPMDKMRSAQEEIREASRRGKELEGDQYQPYLEPNRILQLNICCTVLMRDLFDRTLSMIFFGPCLHVQPRI